MRARQVGGGHDFTRWEVLARALTKPIELKGRFGEFFDRVAAAAPLDSAVRKGIIPPRRD